MDKSELMVVTYATIELSDEIKRVCWEAIETLDTELMSLKYIKCEKRHIRHLRTLINDAGFDIVSEKYIGIDESTVLYKVDIKLPEEEKPYDALMDSMFGICARTLSDKVDQEITRRAKRFIHGFYHGSAYDEMRYKKDGKEFLIDVSMLHPKVADRVAQDIVMYNHGKAKLHEEDGKRQLYLYLP